MIGRSNTLSLPPRNASSREREREREVLHIDILSECRGVVSFPFVSFFSTTPPPSERDVESERRIQGNDSMIKANEHKTVQDVENCRSKICVCYTMMYYGYGNFLFCQIVLLAGSRRHCLPVRWMGVQLIKNKEQGNRSSRG